MTNPFEKEPDDKNKKEKDQPVANPFSPESRAHLTAEQEKPKGFKPRKTFRSKETPKFHELRKDRDERWTAEQQAEHAMSEAQRAQMDDLASRKRKDNK